ncbi:hypothetical protein NDU88_000238 [Pleurodeles waltl]|uniref:Uncharacterized protein n=1 Tax=Pleurodeles waltl TaxID=8319 RepID=A0AAV7V8G6_PLEWA|nr:hypothetical protein NDU88_000238 [Pleurodeles waltl]
MKLELRANVPPRARGPASVTARVLSGRRNRRVRAKRKDALPNRHGSDKSSRQHEGRTSAPTPSPSLDDDGREPGHPAARKQRGSGLAGSGAGEGALCEDPHPGKEIGRLEYCLLSNNKPRDWSYMTVFLSEAYRGNDPGRV